ncbi:hypothetical protein [Sphingomonas sp.]|jgi:hypothetical protein|uniref:hypothetical protein n=1 Tax=Sphingomonas sp. TaxID=28214 RepID=UPI003BABEED2
MTGSPFTPEQEARIRKIARDQSTSLGMVSFLFSLIAIVLTLLLIFLHAVEWIFA